MTTKPRLNEAQVQMTIVDGLRRFAWTWYHQRPARLENGEWRTALSGCRGFPDIVACRGGQMIAWELKGSTGKASEDQELWLAEFALVPGVDARVVGPDDLDEALAFLARATGGSE